MMLPRHRDVPGFVRSLELNYSVPFHAVILLAAATLAGLLVSRLFLWIGMETPSLRFPIAVVAAYVFFLVLVDWWLHYVGVKRTAVDDVPDPGSYPSAGHHGAAIHTGLEAKALALALAALLIGFAVRLVDPSADTIGEAVARLASH